MVDNNPNSNNGRGGLIGGATDWAQGLFSGYSATESFTKALLSMGSAYETAAYLASVVSWICEALGLTGFAEKAHNFGISMAQRAGNMDVNSQTSGDPRAPSDENDPTVADLAYKAGGPAAGAGLGLMAGRTLSVAPDLLGRAANAIKGVETPKGGILGKLLGRTTFGKYLTLGAGVLGAGLGLATAAENTPEVPTDAPAITDAATPTVIPSVTTEGAPEISSDFDGVRATGIGMNGLYEGAIDAVSSLGYVVDGVNWTLAQTGLPVSEQPFLGHDFIHDGLSSVYNAYADNIAPGLNAQPQNSAEALIGDAGYLAGQFAGAGLLAKGMQAANVSAKLATTNNVAATDVTFDVTRALSSPAIP